MAWPQTDPTRSWNNDRSTWMTQLDDDLLIRDLSIPGTHDSTALVGWTHFGESETQDWKVEEQLQNGIRFLDLRVKRKDSDLSELAMWHGSDFIYDAYSSNSRDQLYFRTVIEKCANWLELHPGEAIIISVKDEENSWDAGWSLGSVAGRVYQILTEVNRAHQGPNYRKMWHNHDVSCTLKDARGKLILWKRFDMWKYAQLPDDARLPGTDLTDLNADAFNNTKGAITANNLFYVQDYYGEASLRDKIYEWIRTCVNAYDTRRGTPDHPVAGQLHALQIINHVSKAGYEPKYNASVLNPLVKEWLNQFLTQPQGPLDDGSMPATPESYRFRAGIGVVPMDFPGVDPTILDAIIKLNFQWTYNMMYWQAGGTLWNRLAAEAGTKEK